MRLWPKANESLKPAPFAVLADAAEPAWSSRGGWVNKLLFKVYWGSPWKEVTSGKYLVAGVHCPVQPGGGGHCHQYWSQAPVTPRHTSASSGEYI